MKWIVSQRLLPKINGGRAVVNEIMGTSLRVQDAIVNGEAEGKTFYEMMEQSEHLGWTTFDANISTLFKRGRITEETALAFANRRAVVKRHIDHIKASRGEKTTDIEGLKMDQGYRRTMS
jgi:twitching motility protein PilT